MRFAGVVLNVFQLIHKVILQLGRFLLHHTIPRTSAALLRLAETSTHVASGVHDRFSLSL